MIRKIRRKTRKRYTRKRGGASPDRVYIFTVPYRLGPNNENRKKEIQALMGDIKEYFGTNNRKYKIVVIEQNNSLPFNLGKVRNIGFLEGEKAFTDANKIYIHINCEAEGLLAMLCKNNIIDGCISEDTDVLVNYIEANVLFYLLNKQSSQRMFINFFP
jgi:hypothetical protein